MIVLISIGMIVLTGIIIWFKETHNALPENDLSDLTIDDLIN